MILHTLIKMHLQHPMKCSQRRYSLIQEQLLLSIKAQLCTHSERKTFRSRRPSSVAIHKVHVRHGPIYVSAVDDPLHDINKFLEAIYACSVYKCFIPPQKTISAYCAMWKTTQDADGQDWYTMQASPQALND